MIIAIDGPAGAGKSTISRKVAEKLEFTYLDTGAMYRAFTLLILKKEIPLRNTKLIEKALEDFKIMFIDNKIFMNNLDVTKDIRSEEVTSNVSYISSLPFVRKKMVELQRKIGQNNNIVVEGRDIGTVVFPNADYKFYLDAGQDGFLTHKLIFSLKKAKIALLIDDFGYTNDDRLINTFFQEIPVPLTISIIPGTHFAEKIAKEAHRQKKQILVHLPMQPRGKFVNRYRWIILKGMSGEKIEETAREAIESIPYAQGLNNHMGSLVTTQKELMKPLLQVLKEKKMFFVDSRTSPSSIGY